MCEENIIAVVTHRAHKNIREKKVYSIIQSIQIKLLVFRGGTQTSIIYILVYSIYLWITVIEIW